MLIRPTYKQCFHIEVLSQDQIVLLTEGKQFLLKGIPYVLLSPYLIKGGLSLNEIIECLADQIPGNIIHQAIENLEKNGYLAESLAKSPNHAFWHEIGADPHVNHDKSVSIVSIGDVDTTTLASILTDMGAHINKESASLTLVVTDHYLRPEISAWNLRLRQNQQPWMLIKPNGTILWMGPLFTQRTGCWDCLKPRLLENRRAEVDLYGVDLPLTVFKAKSSLNAAMQLCFNWTAIETMKWLMHSKSSFEGCVTTFDAATSTIETHHLIKSQLCKVCYPHILKLELPKLKTSLKGYFGETGERSISLENTLDKVEKHVSPITGFISKIKHLKVHDMHICYTIRNLPLLRDIKKGHFRNPGAAVGKGTTILQARVGCIAEALERYNCCYKGYEFEIESSYDNMNEKAVDPQQLLHFSQNQYQERLSLNPIRGPLNQIPKPYHSSINLHWTPTLSLMTNETHYVPSAYCFFDYPYSEETQYFNTNSNGCASGNTMEEATFYAILELIERDAVAIWWYHRLKRPSVDLQSFGNDSLKQFEQLGRNLVVLDITTDVMIPSFVAISWQSDGKRIIFGAGAHLDAKIAIARAIAELKQVMSRADTPQNQVLDKISPNEKEIVKWILTEEVNDHPYLIPENICKKSEDYRYSSGTEDFLKDILLCRDRLTSCNLEILLLNLTHPDSSLYTVRAIIPTMRTWWSALGPGRLFDVPVKLGWTEKILQENELNPVPFFL